MVKVNVNGKEFSIDGYLKAKLDNVKDIVNNKNFDCVFLIDGMERIGKSTLGITCAYYLSDGTFSVDNIAIDSDDAIKKIEVLPDKSILLIDEGSLIFSSRDSMRSEQKKLLKIMNVVGQKNMIFIVVLPCFFDLNRQVAVRRSRFLLHCYSDKNLGRGRFAFFGESKKKMLYELGKKHFDSYSRPSANFIARFTSFNPLGQEYLDTKKKSLFSSLHEDEKKDVRIIISENNRKIIGCVEEYEFPFPIRQEDKAKMLGMNPKTYRNNLAKLRQQQVSTLAPSLPL